MLQKKEMQALVDSYDRGLYSHIFDNGECVLLLSSSFYEEDSQFIVRYKDEFLFEMADKEEYSPLKYKSALSEMNKGDKVYFTGKVIETSDEDFWGLGKELHFVKCKIEENRTVYVDFNLEYAPIEFRNGKKYTFFGNLAKPSNDGVPVITLDGFE
jgi:hypothetical protein